MKYTGKMHAFKHTYARFILMKQRGNEEELPNNGELTALRDCKSSASGLNKRCNVKFLRGKIKLKWKTEPPCRAGTGRARYFSPVISRAPANQRKRQESRAKIYCLSQADRRKFDRANRPVSFPCVTQYHAKSQTAWNTKLRTIWENEKNEQTKKEQTEK